MTDHIPVTTRIGTINQQVVMLWDVAITELALTPDDADKMADALKRHAEECRNQLAALTKD